jgi:hypothetical protein
MFFGITSLAGSNSSQGVSPEYQEMILKLLKIVVMATTSGSSSEDSKNF